MEKKIILRNMETGVTVKLPFLHETRRALGVGDQEDPIWLPKSQLRSHNMMYLSEEDREMIKDLGETVHSCYLYGVPMWLWRAKSIPLGKYRREATQ